MESYQEAQSSLGGEVFVSMSGRGAHEIDHLTRFADVCGVSALMTARRI